MNLVCENKVDNSKVNIFSNISSSIKNVHSVAILTEWEDFKNYDWKGYIEDEKDKVNIYDFRNIIKDQLNDYKHYFKL